MKSIRILQLFTILNRGGAETMVMNYYRHIDRNKIQFDFAVHRREKGAYEDEIHSLGGKIYRFLPLHPKNFIVYKKQISKFFDEHPEYHIIHGHVSELGYFFYKEAYKRKIPCIIMHAHNTSMDMDLKAPFRYFFIHASRKYLSHYFSCSQKAFYWYFGKNTNKKNYILNNAIDAEKFLYDKYASTTIKKKLSIDNKFVIGNVARFSAQKNHLFLIEIFSKIYKKNKNAILALVGDGNLRPKIEARAKSLHIEDAILFLGIRSDIPELMQSFDVFLFPSLYEGLGVALIEAQAAGLKCIVSTGVPEEAAIIPDLVDFISLEKSASYWADAILKYANGYERENTHQELIKAGYNIKNNAKWLENFYLINNSNA
jgi:glycosyltransferase involved in cell wall biosynthesis